jgi:long-subunit fatty acid transport protein
MKIKNLLLTALLITSISSLGQSNFKTNSDFGLAFSPGSQEFNVALSWKQIHSVKPDSKFKVGYGLRFNLYTGTDKEYITAPAELTSGKTGPGVFFSENIIENLDTFLVGSAQHNSLNATIYLEYDFTEKWGIGFNIDAAGLAFGKETSGVINSLDGNNLTVVGENASPTKGNLLLISDNDIGMLNSELYVTYNVNKRLAINAGFTFLFTEYTTTNPITINQNNDRFRHKTLLGLISINYKPFNK